MLGIGIEMEPRRSLRSVIIFFTIFVVSFFFISDLISDMTTLKYTNEKVPIIESFEDIITKNLTLIYLGNQVTLTYLKDRSEGFVKNITRIIRLWRINDTLSYEKIAILNENLAERMVDKYNGVLDGIEFQISNLILYSSYYVTSFPTNSPLRQKFGAVYARILEAGLDVKWRSDYNHANKISKKRAFTESEDEDNTLPIVLKTLMVVGIIISSTALLFEYIWFYRPWLKLKVGEFCNFMKSFTKRRSLKKVKVIKIHVKPREMQMNSV